MPSNLKYGKRPSHVWHCPRCGASGCGNMKTCTMCGSPQIAVKKTREKPT